MNNSKIFNLVKTFLVSINKTWNELDSKDQLGVLIVVSMLTFNVFIPSNMKNLKGLSYQAFILSTGFVLGEKFTRSKAQTSINQALLESANQESELKSKINFLETSKESLELHIQNLNGELADKQAHIEEMTAHYQAEIERIDSQYQDDKKHLISKIDEEKKEYYNQCLRKIKTYRTKLIRDNQQLIEQYRSKCSDFDNLKASQLELIELLEQHIMNSKSWKTQAENEFSRICQQYDFETRELRLKAALVPKSKKFNGSDRASINGNRLLDLFESNGFLANAEKAETTNSKDLIWISSTNSLCSDFESLSEVVHQTFELIKRPSFTLDKGLIKIELNHSKQEFSINSIVRPYTDFEVLSQKWERIKIDGGSESGKSPFAENLIALKYSQHETCIVKLSNPLYGSKKDFWKIQANWTSYDEAEQGLSKAVSIVKGRNSLGRKAKSSGLTADFSEFQLFVFDEIDTTLAKSQGARSSLKEILKTASHYGVGLIFIGQSPYCSDVGLKQADFANCVQIHIGSICNKAIELSSYSQELKAKLQNQYNQISAFYADKNRFITDQISKYRFALVDDGNSDPFYIELPPIRHYSDLLESLEADSVAESGKNLTESKMSETLVESGFSQPDSGIQKIHCPNCGDSNHKRNGSSKSSQKFLCKSCGKGFSIPKQLIETEQK